VTAERDKLQRALTDERAALAATRAALERAAAEQRAEVERAAALDRQRIEELRAEIRRAGELEVEKKRQTALDEITDETATYDREELATPLFIPPVNVPLEQLVFNDDTPVMQDEEIAFTPAKESSVPIAMPDEPADEPEAVVTEVPQSRRKWLLGGAVAGVVALAVATAVVVGNRQRATPPATPAVAHAPVASAPVAAAPVGPAVPLPSAPIVDSSAGSVARQFDSTSAVSAAVASAPPKPKRVVRDSTPRPRRDTTTASTTPVHRDSAPARRRAMSLSDSIFTIPGAAPIRRDSVKPDTSTPPPEN
jgi:hypothetical protein